MPDRDHRDDGVEGPEVAYPPLSEYRPQEVPYDPSRHRELVRSILAIGSIGLVALEVIGFLWMFAFGTRDFGELKDLVGVILSPSIALASAATGFYFGGHK